MMNALFCPTCVAIQVVFVLVPVTSLQFSNVAQVNFACYKISSNIILIMYSSSYFGLSVIKGKF